MPFETINVPSVGDPTKKQSFAEKVINNLVFLYNAVTSLFGTGEIIKNGSFENDTDSDGVPDGWTKTLYPAGAFDIVTATADVKHGAKAIRFTRSLGVGNGGGYVESEDFFEVTDGRSIAIQWHHKVSAAGLKDLVELFWFDESQVALGTASTTLYSSTANPTAWTLQYGGATPPTGARYAKLRITGGFTDTDVAGTSHWDDVKISEDAPQFLGVSETFDASATWKVPFGVARVRVQAWGGGGSGSGGSPGGGGGGGAYAEGLFDVTAGDDHTITIGAGASQGSGTADGSAGGDTSLGSLLTAGGGQGATAAGVGGAGGTTTAQNGLSGEAGQNGSGSDRDGGGAARGGQGGHGASGTAVVPGGGGNGTPGIPDKDGADGRVIVSY